MAAKNRRIGKLYKTVIHGRWLRTQPKWNAVPASRQDSEGKFTIGAPIPVGSYVMYLGAFNWPRQQGFRRVLWDEQVYSVHNQWLTETPAGKNKDNDDCA